MHLQLHNVNLHTDVFLRVSSHPFFTSSVIFLMVSADPRYAISVKVTC